jgi:hypothetical protein
MQWHFLGRGITGDELARSIKARQPPSSSLTEILPEEPGVRPRSNSDRPRRQISSRIFVSLMAYLVSRFGSAAKP